MVLWGILIFVLGIFGILQDAGVLVVSPSYRVLTWVVMLIALGIFWRIRYKQQAAEKEKMQARIEELERKLGEAQRGG